jgi:hypothetical protein
LAVGELCGQILSLSDNPATNSQFEQLHDELVSELDEELPVLSMILPILEEITGKSYKLVSSF